jgi:hypothetical protein
MANNNDNSNDQTNEATQPNAEAETSGSAAPTKPQTLREATTNASHAFGFRGAYLQLKPHYDEMPADNLPPVTLDVNKIIVLGMGVLPEVEKLRAVIQDECPRLPADVYTGRARQRRQTTQNPLVRDAQRSRRQWHRARATPLRHLVHAGATHARRDPSAARVAAMPNLHVGKL